MRVSHELTRHFHQDDTGVSISSRKESEDIEL